MEIRHHLAQVSVVAHCPFVDGALSEMIVLADFGFRCQSRSVHDQLQSEAKNVASSCSEFTRRSASATSSLRA